MFIDSFKQHKCKTRRVHVNIKKSLQLLDMFFVRAVKEVDFLSVDLMGHDMVAWQWIHRE